jgi:hypothetical protein
MKNFLLLFVIISFISSNKVIGQCSKPVISFITPPRIKCSRDSALFKVMVSGTAPFSYCWDRKGSNVCKTIYSSYIVSVITPLDSGEYCCHVSNACGVDSACTKLFVNTPTFIQDIFPETKIKNVGDTMWLEVTPTRGYPIYYQWLHNNNILVGATTNPYIIKSITCQDTGVYSVTFGNNCGNQTFKVETLLVRNCGNANCKLKVTANVTNATCDTCYNGSATANVANGFAPYTWTWYTSPLQTTQTATGLNPGTYTVCVHDDIGCIVCNQFVIIGSKNCSGFSITTKNSNETCITCADGYAWVDAKGGKPPYRYTWFTSPVQVTDTAKGLSHGKYQVCVTDLYGCTTCDTVTIKTGYCSAHFDLYPTSTPHVYNVVNKASGKEPINYFWSWGDGKSDTIAYPTHSYDTSGYYKICLSITDFAGCKNTYCNSFYLLKSPNPMIKVNVIPDIIGINEISGEKSIYIYPNPTSNELYISKTKYLTLKKINIIDVTGRLLRNEYPQNSDIQKIEVNYLAKGLYFIEFDMADGKRITAKFLKD